MDDFNFQVEYDKPNLAQKARLGLPSLLMIIFVFAMSGIGSLLQINVEFHEIAWMAFLCSTAIRLALNFCSRWVGGSSRYQRDEASEAVSDARNEFSTEMKEIDIADFSKWAEGENRREKERVYRDNINAAILTLERKISERRNRLRLRKRDAKYIAKRERRIEELRARCDDDFIEKNLPYIRVAYDHIDPVDFMTSAQTDHARRKYTYDATKEISVDVMKGLPIVILTSLAGSLITMSAMVGSINAASVIYDLMTATISFTMGWIFIGAKNTAKSITVLNNKRAVVLKYKKQK